jgi:ParB/RepB/Spo0J family partition protein
VSRIIKLYPHDLRENPFQTRNDLSVGRIGDLVRSIKHNGQDEPIEVYRDVDGKWTILEGHRRTLACAQLGTTVRCRVVKKPLDSEIMQMIYRRNTVRRDHTPSGVICGWIDARVERARAQHYRVTLRDCARELCMSYVKVRQCYSLYKKLKQLDARAADRCVREKWSEAELRVAVGMPVQREHKGKRPLMGNMKPLYVVLHEDPDGQRWLSCKVAAGADPQVLCEYYESLRGWPVIDIQLPGVTREKRLNDNHERRVRARLGEVALS